MWPPPHKGHPHIKATPHTEGHPEKSLNHPLNISIRTLAQLEGVHCATITKLYTFLSEDDSFLPSSLNCRGIHDRETSEIHSGWVLDKNFNVLLGSMCNVTN